MVKSHLDIFFMTDDTANHRVGRPVLGLFVCFCFSNLLVSMVCLFLSFYLLHLFSQTIWPCIEWPQAHSLNFIFLKIFMYFLSDLIQSLDFQYLCSYMVSSHDDICQFYITSSPCYVIPDCCYLPHLKLHMSQTGHYSLSHHNLIPVSVSILFFPLLNKIARNNTASQT